MMDGNMYWDKRHNGNCRREYREDCYNNNSYDCYYDQCIDVCCTQDCCF
ncbi:hypothetical protein [Cellulosilyticum sp. I15G10I2]|nr:hypothetical protein [Cellulosilyticum sp. I15G10I2]